MEYSEDTYKNWIKGSWFSTSRSLYYMAKGMIEELGEEKGIELFIKQTYEFGRSIGTSTRERYQKNGIENNLTNFMKEVGSEDIVYAVAWKGGPREVSGDDWVVEWSYCPIAEGFKHLGEEAMKIGEIFCTHVDNASMETYNPDISVVRESSLNLDGVCRLRFKKKT